MSQTITIKPHVALEQRLNRFPQGAPPSETLYRILGILFSEREASLVARLPVKPFTAKKAASIWNMPYNEALQVLEGLADRCLLVDMEVNGDKQYILPPPMAGFFEFSMMRLRTDIDQKLLGELFYQYMNVEEDFIRQLFLSTETRLGRVFVNEEVLPADPALEILDFERATNVIKTATHIGIGTCYCRHKMQHVGKNCDAPMDICMTFNNVASSLTRHGYARQVEASECTEILHQAYEANLVQFGENIQKGVSFICNCCGCCCEGLVAARKFGSLRPVATSSFVPELNADSCTGCGKCARVCPVEAISMVPVSDSKKKLPEVDESICLGCGVCARACPTQALSLKKHGRKIITPVNSVHKTVLIAIERGMLQELIFDNKALFSHRAMAAILGAILKMPPVKQIMASRQMKSVYLVRLIERMSKPAIVTTG